MTPYTGNVSAFRHHKALPDGLKRRLDAYLVEREDVRKQSVKELERRRLAGTVLDPNAGSRWALQRTAAKIMREVETRGEDKHYRYRVTLCNAGVSDWHSSPDEPRGIRVYRSPDALRAEFRGVMTCGSTWHCPCCSPKIAKTRVSEINHAMQLWQNGHQGERGIVLFGTFTYQHERDRAGAGQLVAQLAAFTQALSELKRDGPYRRILVRAGYKGAIRGLETTYGELNGWHNHTHEILFVRCGAEWSDYMAALRVLRGIRTIWARKLISCGLAGLDPMDAPLERRKKLRDLLTRCYVIQHGGFACDYLAKFGKEPERQRGRWGLGSELARSHLKAGGARSDGALPARCNHASPWELLNDAHDGDERSALLYREYGEAFHGRRQLYWSKGLKDFFGVNEREDDSLAAQPDRRCTQYVGTISRDQWRAVLIADTRFTVLAIAARDGREFMQEYLERLERKHVSGADPPFRAAA